jgi:nitrite reductase/ring-hydroxylating ferredoxin subunit
MLSRILGLLRRPGVLIRGVDKLPEGEGRKVSIGDPLAGGTEIVLCRVGGKLHAVDVICPHEGGRIVGGPLVEKQYLMCPLHNYKFEPATGRAIGAACKNAKTYRVVAKGADCEVFV